MNVSGAWGHFIDHEMKIRALFFLFYSFLKCYLNHVICNNSALFTLKVDPANPEMFFDNNGSSIIVLSVDSVKFFGNSI